jgi:hypothetical protein
MDRSRYRWVLRLAIVLVLGLIALLWTLSQRGRTLSIENHAEQPITTLQITLGGDTFTFKDVASRAEVTATSKGHGEVSWSVEGKLANGSLIRGNGKIKDSLQLLLLPDGNLQEKPKRKEPMG